MMHNGKPVIVKTLPFPDSLRGTAGGFAVVNDKEYTVAVDEGNAAIVQRFVLGHELAHVFLNHLEAHLDREDVRREEQEREANKRAWEFYRAYRDHAL